MFYINEIFDEILLFSMFGVSFVKNKVNNVRCFENSIDFLYTSVKFVNNDIKEKQIIEY